MFPVRTCKHSLRERVGAQVVDEVTQTSSRAERVEGETNDPGTSGDGDVEGAPGETTSKLTLCKLALRNRCILYLDGLTGDKTKGELLLPCLGQLKRLEEL